MSRISDFSREFFYGAGELGVRGRYIMLVLDSLIILYFLGTTFLELSPWIFAADIAIGVLLSVELFGRVMADRDKMGLLSKPLALLDIVIILSLFLPWIFGNFAFLRVIRALRVLRSYAITRNLKQFRFFARNEEVFFSALNLLVFIFIISAFVFVLQQDPRNPAIANYVDALYFTITTLTTTGFGDVVLVGNQGRVLSIVIMIVGVALFLRLIQALFRPTRVRHECPQCGLTRHEMDAVHCKHCGRELHIRTEGMV